MTSYNTICISSYCIQGTIIIGCVRSAITRVLLDEAHLHANTNLVSCQSTGSVIPFPSPTTHSNTATSVTADVVAPPLPEIDSDLKSTAVEGQPDPTQGQLLLQHLTCRSSSMTSLEDHICLQGWSTVS